MVEYNGQRTRNTRNINLSDNDLARLLSQGQPGNVTGGREGNPGILGLLNQQNQKDTFQMTPKYQPRLTTADLINRNNQSPEMIQPQVPSSVAENPVAKIMSQLQQLLTQGIGSNSQNAFTPTSLPSFDPNRYKKQAESAVNSQFDPIIQDLYAQQKATTNRATTNKAEVANMYQGAVNDINLGAAQTQKGYDQTEAASKQLYTDERNRIAAAYAADAAAQRSQAQKLGTEALGVNEAIAKQTADKNFADQLGSQQMQSSQNALGQQEQGAANYDKAIAQATQSEGMEQQSDINKQLQDLLGQSNSDIASTRSQAAGSIQDLMMKLAQAAYDRDSQNAQFQYQQQRDYIGDQNSLYDRQYKALMDQLNMAQAAQAAGSSSDQKLNPWQDTATFAESLQPGQGSDIVAAIQAAMNGRPEIYARSKGDPVDMNPALFAKLVADYPQNSGLDRNTLMQVAQELYRQLYGT